MMIFSSLAPMALIAAVAQPASAPAPPASPAQAPAPRELRIDANRLIRDRAYAERSLAEIEAFRAAHGISADNETLLLLSALALAGLEREEEAAAAIDRRLAMGGPQPQTYAELWRAAARIEDLPRMVSVVEAAARNVPAERRSELHPRFEPMVVEILMRHFLARGEGDVHTRLAEALFALDWPGEGYITMRDALRFGALERRRLRGDTAGAAAIARTIDAPDILLPLLVLDRYAPLRPQGEPLDVMAAAIARADAAGSEALAAAPENIDRANDRVRFLRMTGRPADALAAAQPFLADPEATARRPNGNWLVNEAVYALLDLGRRDEAVALMSRLAAMDIERHPELISQTINHVAVLRRAGRHAEALAHARRLDADLAPEANMYARMWIASGLVCALADLGRAGEAAEKLAWMRGQEAANPAALSRSLLCLGDVDAAEALLLRRLGAEGGEALLASLQDYRRTAADERDDPIARRWAELRERPAVRAAIGRAGRVLELPLAKIYWGDY